jgi:tellurite resistance protein TerC
LYVFGAVLVYTGISMFSARNDEAPDLNKNRVYKWMKRVLPLTTEDGDGKLFMVIDGKKFYTSIFVVIILLATTDVIFAVDSIPAVFGISQDKLVIYTSNIFAVLGLRSLFFLLRGAVQRFRYLQHGIAIVLVFIGLKMLSEVVKIHIPVFVSLLVIVVCIMSAIGYSLLENRKNKLKNPRQLS